MVTNLFKATCGKYNSILSKIFLFSGLILITAVLTSNLEAKSATVSLNIPSYNVVDLGTLGGNYSDAYSVNDNYQVVGNSNPLVLGGAPPIAYIYYGLGGLGMKSLGTLGGPVSVGQAINNNGEVVGFSLMPNSSEIVGAIKPIHAYYYSPTSNTMWDIVLVWVTQIALLMESMI